MLKDVADQGLSTCGRMTNVDSHSFTQINAHAQGYDPLKKGFP